MALVRGGDTRAFADLYERHRTAVFTFLVRLTGNYHLAEDLLQEAFIRVYRGRHNYQPSGRFRTWLFTITGRLVVDHYRRQRLVWEQEPEAIEAADRAEHRVETHELLERVERALKKLSPAQRETIVLSRFAGMGADEIASVTGSTAGAVRVALHRALRLLRILLEQTDPNPRKS